MKKITQLAIILCTIAQLSGQNQATITIKSVTPNPVYAGDTLTVNFTFVAPSPGGSISQDQWYISSQNQGQIQGVSYPTYYGLPKTINAPGDTTYHLKIKTLTTHSIGAGTVKANNSNVIPIFFCCDITGISEYNTDNLVPVYYDLMGNKISPIHNQVIIEQKGIHRRKIIIQD